MENDNAGLETVEVNDDDEASLDDEDQGLCTTMCFIFWNRFLGPVGSFGMYMILQSMISRCVFEASWLLGYANVLISCAGK